MKKHKYIPRKGDHVYVCSPFVDIYEGMSGCVIDAKPDGNGFIKVRLIKETLTEREKIDVSLLPSEVKRIYRRPNKHVR